MKFFLLFFLLASLTSLCLARRRRRLFLPRQSSYNKFMSKSVLNFEKAKVETQGAIFKRHVQQLRHIQNKQVELVFLIDSSGTVGSHYFYEELRFVKNLLADFTVDMNSTRVSVITFSSPHKIFRHIDYMSEPTEDNHKCRLLQEDIPSVDYTPGGTHTLGAFLEAEKVLRSARAGATKAIFLMTDGYSNGGDPRPIAHKLKAQGVRIFTFGIRDGFVWELQRLASEPKNETCYILDSFEEFEALAKRALHTDLQTGSYISQSLSKCGKLCNNGGKCCHDNATCSCGTYTGKYECLCKPGFYGMGVGKTGCRACPHGSYKNYTGLGACTPCPNEHQMTPLGANSFSLCKCKKGYRNFGSEECTVFRCSKLSPPKHGYFVNNKCNNVFNAACGLRCNSGYELRGSSLRSCQEDGNWSGQQAECIMKTCPSLPQPKNGHMICSTDDFSYSTVCRFTCNNGYQLVGSRKRTCLAIAFWTGIATRCREITCPPLVEIKDGTIQPASCLSSEVVFGTTCQVSCRSGYKLKGPHTKQCTPDGTWMTSEKGANLCIDESAPIFHCPPNIDISADEEDSLTPVFWTEPVPVDNSGLRPVITSEPSVSPGSTFPIGQTTVMYRAKDLSNNVATCQFTIKVIDKTPPRIDKCLSPPPIVSKTKLIAVNLEEPKFSDNSGRPVEVAPSRRPKDLFPIGKHKVTYTAFDPANNNNTCVVEVVIVPHLCMTPEPPANGNITCKKGKKGVTCHISCKKGFAFANEANTDYSCLFEEGVWKPQEQFPFQDCSVVQVSNDILQPASITLTSDISCKDTRMLSEIVGNFEEEVKNKLSEACDNELSCKFGGLSFVCEDNEDLSKVPQIVSSRRKRRSIADIGNARHVYERSKISVKFSLSGSVTKDKKNQELEAELMKAVNDMLSAMKKQKSQSRKVKGKSVAIQEMSFDINDPEYQCEPGSIVVDKMCVSCPAGTFCNSDQKYCNKCPRGTFQDKENQTSCIRCPNDKSTMTDNCRNVNECKGLCSPGSFSLTGLAPCETCHHGFYQSDYGSRECHVCQDGKTTKRRGSSSEESCADLCPPGYASRTGLSPCFPCPSASYQPKVGQTECFKCPGGGNTFQSGAIYLLQCVRSSDSWEIQSDGATADQTIPFSTCDFESPCQNGGSCESQDASLFTCRCPPGFAGDTCEDTVDPCKGDPCLNGALCLPENGKARCYCLDGYSGVTCEVNIDDCVIQPCQNKGICVDGINSFSCNCQPGFTGETCDILSENCDNKPCLNGGTCNVDDDGVNCECSVGFTGELCEQNIDECLSVPCHNDATCNDLPGGYSCTCIPGYTGDLCEVNIDECELYKPCSNGGRCEDSVNAYICNCPDGFTGTKCETVLTPYYQLDFGTPSILDYAQMSISQPLSAVTASFWMKTTDDDNQGTPFSYAVKDQPDAFTITDYKNLNIYINGEVVSAELRLNDGEWQHVVFIWSNIGGEWKIYKNGLLIDQGSNLSTRKDIPASGTFIVGQEQDEQGGGFSASETFVGSLTQLNVWDRELSLDEIEKLRFSCEDFQGNVIAWPRVQAFLKGSLIRSSSSFCDDCPNPESPPSGSVKFSGLRPNDDVVYSCDEGFNTAGRSEFKCLVSGEWETESPYCQPVSCGHPGSPDNGYIAGRDFSFGKRIRFICNRGFELDGPEYLTCTKYEEWDDDIPDCIEIQCEVPLLSANTIATATSTFVIPGTVVGFSCTSGNKLLSKHNSSLCQVDGTFDKSIPTCDPERCPIPQTIDNGEPKDIKQDYGVGESVHYQCFYGYRLNPEVGNRKGSINCLPTGEWEDDLPECEEILCPDPPSLPNARAVGKGHTVDAEVTYQCNPGYRIVGKNSAVCQEIGEWSRVRARCRPISCGSPPQISFGSFTGQVFTFKSTISYQCDQGYSLDGNQERSCQEDGQWQGDDPSCLPVSCGEPENIKNGQITYANIIYGESALYSCDPGYVLSGTSTVICEASRQWKPDPPSCNPRPCPIPPDVADATYKSPFELVFNANVEYTCNTGHVLSGSPVLVCNENATWGPTAPVCNKIKCPKPSPPESGSVSAKDLSYSSIATHFCDEGYKLIGLDSRTCQADGTWSDEIPTCEATSCQAPNDPENGLIQYKSLSIGSIIMYSCNKGYELEGDSIRKCKPDLSYDGVVPICKPVDCGDISTLKDGTISFSTDNMFFGTQATFTCNTGFNLDGAKTITCDAYGKWSETSPQCKPVECPKVSKVTSNGRVTGSSFTYGSVLSYHCNEGYRLDGQANRTCQSNENWDNPIPSCQIVQCPRPTLVYGTVSTFDRNYGTKLRYSCRGSYRLEGPTERTCLADGKWSGPDPNCLKINCAVPQSVDNAETKVINETAIQYTCKKGYNMVGSVIRVCGIDEIWRPDPPSCTPSFCEDLTDETLLNGEVLFTSANAGETVNYKCNVGYDLRGDKKRRCLSSGLWEGSAPICLIVECGHPGILINGHIIGSDYTFNATAGFECELGYKLQGVESIRCLETGEWENEFPYCDRVYCPELQKQFENGEVYVDSNSYLSFAEYFCAKGYNLNGSKERECLGTGEWSGSKPVCEPVVCPVPETVTHGILFGEKGVYGYGDEISYQCEEGYYLIGKGSRYCTEDASWTEWIPQCYSIKCPEPPFLENGYFRGDSASYKSVLSFSCFEGFQLIGEKNITCQLNKTWTGGSRRCERVSCGQPLSIENAYIDQSTNFVYEARVVYFCNKGFIPSGHNLTQCLANGTWSYLDFLCTIVSCPSFTSVDVPHGIFRTPSFIYKDQVVFSCKEGYRLSGERIIECQSNGQWNSSLPSCTIIQCPPLGSVASGSVQMNSHDYGSVVTISCDTGYILKGSPGIICLSSGLWNDSLPLCEIISCPAPPNVPYSSLSNPQDSYVFDSRVEYVCNYGYELQGLNILRCTAQGKYDIPAPICNRIPCPEVEDFAFGSYSWVNETFILYACNSGFYIVGDALRECVLGGVWNSISSFCRVVPCPSPSVIENGEVIGSNFTFGNSIEYRCNAGYNLNGASISLCQEVGTWSENNAHCLPVRCGEPEKNIENGYVEGDVYTYGHSVEYLCLPAFKLQGRNIRTCLEDGQWSHSVPKCIRQRCEEPDPIPNGIIHGDIFLYESYVSYNCSEGFTLDGSQTRRCESSLKWSGSNPVCVRVSCSPPQNPANGNYIGTSYFFEDVIQVSCNRGFELEGPQSRTCLADQSWSGTDPNCKRIYCPAPDELRHAFSDNEPGNTFVVDSDVAYFCDKGYIMNGTGQRICEPSGFWSTNVLECRPVICPAVNGIENGVITSDSPETPFTYTANLFFSCNPGFRLKGETSITCGPYGDWSEDVPTCSIIECENLQIENGFSVLSSDGGLKIGLVREAGTYYAGDSVTIQCNSGYEVVGSSNTNCSLNGNWISENIYCQRVQCPLPLIENGEISGNSYLYQDVIQISCISGYKLEGSESRTCLSDQSWSGTDAVCKRIYCPAPDELKNAFSDDEPGNTFVVDSDVAYFCDKGYIMNGTGQRICEPSGYWSTNFLECRPVICPAVNGIENGVITSDSPETPFTYPATLAFVCNSGFTLEGRPSIKCDHYGDWSETIPTCSINECEHLEIENGLIQLLPESGLKTNFIRKEGKFYAGDNVAFQCNIGYEIDGASNVYCSMGGLWSSKSFCNPVTCQIPVIESAKFTAQFETYKRKVSVVCEEGLDLIGSDELTCGANAAWEEELPRCELLVCGSPHKVVNAVLKGESFKLGDTVIYECKPGYILIGNNILTCGPSNRWLGSYPTCVRVNCGQPEPIRDSYLEVNRTTFEGTATIYCTPGYKLKGNQMIVCGPDGQWKIDPSSQCNPLDCGSPPNIPHGSASPEGTTFGSLAVYTCNAGHFIEGASSMYCDEDGRWGIQIPICSPVSCLSDPPEVEHASYSRNGSVYRDKVTYLCYEGYTFAEPSATSLTCGDMGNWKGKIPLCKIIDCGHPPALPFAFSYLLKHDTTYLNVATYFCIPGYKSNSSTILKCGNQGTWEGDIFQCAIVDCLSYPDLPNGEYPQENGTLFEAEVFYKCFKGYYKTGPDFITCTSEGKWTNPSCSPVDCSNPPSLLHGQYQFDSTTYQSKAQYVCQAGYLLVGNPVVECLHTSLWSPSSAQCKPLNCQDPPDVDNAAVAFNTTFYGGKAEYSCEIGYTSSMPMSLVCGVTGKWSSTVPKCDIVSCPLPEKLATGFVSYTEITYLSTAVYGCDSGNKLVGDNKLTCLENGTWSHEVPTCSPLDCSQPVNIINGRVTTSGTHFGASAHYVCLEGFLLEGDAYVFCNDKGSWNSSAPKCKIIDCKEPPPLKHGIAEYIGTTFNFIANYICDKGYSLVGSQATICGGNGQWYDEKRECQRIFCSKPPPLINGLLVSYNITFGSRAVYRCLPDYKPQELSILTCGESGLWKGDVTPCSLKSCDEPVSIEHGSLRYHRPPVINTVVEYFCEKGYTLIGPKDIKCTAEERWWPTTPYCKPVICQNLINVPYSVVQQEDKSGFLSRASFKCQEGYTMEVENNPAAQAAIYTCGENGQWEGDRFECSPITCSFYPPLVEYANYELTNGNSFKSKSLYTCKPGYVMSTEYDVFCDQNGEWSTPKFPFCQIVTCGFPPTIKGADYEGDNFDYGSSVIYLCHQYHRLVGENVLKCLPNGTWMSPAFICDAIKCDLLPEPNNGRILNNLEGLPTVGTVINFSCNDGFTLLGVASSRCQESGQWSLPSPLCQKVIGVCEESIVLKNGVPPPPGKFPGDFIVLQCKDGYVGNGDMNSLCQNDGSWLLPTGTCQRVSCGRPKAHDRRSVRVFGRSFLYGDSVRYMCRRYGFSPAQDPPLLHCLSSGQWDKNASCVAHCKQRCLNGGRCLGRNRCKCMPGWAGFKCHLAICIFPCLNGGRCIGPYKCGCPLGYQGSRCERAMCPRPCQNGGRCLKYGKCRCLPGFLGSACENKILARTFTTEYHKGHLQENQIYDTH